MRNDRFRKLCESLNLGKLISIPSKVTGGLLHTMWHIKTNKNDYAVKELNKLIVVNDQIKNSYEITEKIALAFDERGISAVASMEFNNKSLIEIDKDIFLIYPWIDGITLNCDSISYQHAKKIGSVLARMHLLNLHFPELSSPKWDIYTNEYLVELTNKAIKADLPFAKILKENLTHIFSWNNLFQENIPTLNNNLVVSHGDLDQKNVMWKNDLIPMLIDWESARLLNPTQEILNVALDWSGVTLGKINLTIFETILAEYKDSGGKINIDQTNAAFWAIVGNWLNWMRYNIERSLGERASTKEECQSGIKQVQIVLKKLSYLTANIEPLTKVIMEQ